MAAAAVCSPGTTAQEEAARAEAARLQRLFQRRGQQVPTHGVVAIRLKLLTGEEVRKTSVGEMGGLTTYDAMGFPKRGGVMDPRGGAEDNTVCATCLNTARSGHCHGHPGHMELAVPVYQPQMLQTVKYMLTCVCFACGICLLPERHRAALHDMNFVERLRHAANKTSLRAACPRCGLPTQPKLVTHEKLALRAEWPDATNKLADVDEAMREAMHTALHEFNDPVHHTVVAQCLLSLALSHPIDEPDSLRAVLRIEPTVQADCFLMDVLRVCEKTCRPSRSVDGQRRELHALTRRTLFIASPNENIKKLRHLRKLYDAGTVDDEQVKAALHKSASSLSANDILQELLQFNIADLLTQVVSAVNGGAKLQHVRKTRKGTVTDVACVKDFLGGKFGLIRRRTPVGSVLFSGRAPLSPAPMHWPLDHLGMPAWMAKRITIWTTVTQFNLAQMRTRVRNGYRHIFGANAVMSAAGEEVTLRGIPLSDRLAIAKHLGIGWVVRRTLQDMDTVLFNRAPTLHCMNLMAFKARITNAYTVWMHHTNAKMYNADFDGDEGTIHVPQTLEARADAQELMAVTNYVISPTDSCPALVPTLNSVLAVFLLTAADTTVSADLEHEMLMAAQYHIPLDVLQARLARGPQRTSDGRRSGKALVSTLLPPGFCYGPVRMHDGGTEANDGIVRIVDGQLVCGQWRKPMFSGAHTLTQALERAHGRRAAATFLNAVVSLGETFLNAHGFSVGAGDVLQRASLRAPTRILADRVVAAMAKVDHTDGLAADKEQARASIASMFLQRASDIVHALDEEYGGVGGKHGTNSFGDPLQAIVASGAKGNVAHIAQMRVGLGQQMARNRRIFGTPFGARQDAGSDVPAGTHPPQSHGLITEPYGTVANGAFADGRGGRMGLSPAATITHAASGIAAMCGTSCGVPVMGTAQAALAGGGEFIVVRGNGRVFTTRPDGQDGAPPLNLRLPPAVQAMAYGVVQLVYGGNGLNTQNVLPVDVPWLAWSKATLLTNVISQAPMLPASSLPSTTSRPRPAAVDVPVAADALRAQDWVQAWVRDMLALQRELLAACGSEVLAQHGGHVPTTFPLAFNAHTTVCTTLLSPHPTPSWATGGSQAEVLAHMKRLAACVRTHLLTPLQQRGEYMLPHVAHALWVMRPWQVDVACIPLAAVRACCDTMVHAVERGSVIDGTNIALLATYALGSANTQAELNKKHHVGELSHGGMSLLDRSTELVSNPHKPTRAPHTTLRLQAGVSKEVAQTWLTRHTHLLLRSVLMPHYEGGVALTVVPSPNHGLHACEAAAWHDTWRMYGFGAPTVSEPRTVVVLRLAKTVCRRYHVTVDEVVAFVQRELRRLAGSSTSRRRPILPSAQGPDATEPLVIATRPQDAHWTLLLTTQDWTMLAQLVPATATMSPAQFQSKTTVTMIAMAVVEHLHGERTLRGVRYLRGGRVEPWTRFTPVPRQHRVVREERVAIQVDGRVPWEAVARMEDAGFVSMQDTVWDDVAMTYKHLGIEAARTVWLQKLREITGSRVAPAHLELLADMTCYLGRLLPITCKRRVEKRAWLHVAAQSHTMEVLRDAAAAHTTDYLHNNSSLFVGRAPSSGSNVVEIQSDPSVARAVYRRHKKVVAARVGLRLPRSNTEEESGTEMEEEEDGDVVVPSFGGVDDEDEEGELVVDALGGGHTKADGVEGNADGAEDEDEDEEGMLVVHAPPSQPHRLDEQDARQHDGHTAERKWMPGGVSPRRFKRICVDRLPMQDDDGATAPIPSVLLPKNSTSDDFAFTGVRTEQGVSARVEATHNASALLRRLLDADRLSPPSGVEDPAAAHDADGAVHTQAPLNNGVHPNTEHGGGLGGRTPGAADGGSMSQAQQAQRAMVEDMLAFRGSRYNLTSSEIQTAKRNAIQQHRRPMRVSVAPMSRPVAVSLLGDDAPRQPTDDLMKLTTAQLTEVASHMTPQQRQAVMEARKRIERRNIARKARERRHHQQMQHVKGLKLAWIPSSPPHVSRARSRTLSSTPSPTAASSGPAAPTPAAASTASVPAAPTPPSTMPQISRPRRSSAPRARGAAFPRRRGKGKKSGTRTASLL